MSKVFGRYIQVFSLTIFLCCSVLSCSDPKPQLLPLAPDALILAFGDSLTYGTGSEPLTESYPAVLQELLERKITNAGIPGEVSAQGLIRLKVMLETLSPDLVILCHGANDILRRMDASQTKENLRQMIEAIQLSGAEVVLIAVPEPNLLLTVPDFYLQLAEQFNIPIDLSTMSEIERTPELKSDAIHPNAVGYMVLAERIASLLRLHGAI